MAQYRITQKDYELFATIPTVIRMVPMRIFEKPVYNDPFMWKCRIVGTSPEYQEINRIRMASGRFLVEEDTVERRNVCVLASNAAARLFPYESPLGQTVLIDK